MSCRIPPNIIGSRKRGQEQATHFEIFFRGLETEIADDKAVVAFRLPAHLAEIGDALRAARFPICADSDGGGTLIPCWMEWAQGELLPVDGMLIQLLLHLLGCCRCVEDQDGDTRRAVNGLGMKQRDTKRDGRMQVVE